MNHRIGEFQIAVFHRDTWQLGTQALGQHRELADRELVAAPMAAEHYARAGRQEG